MDKIKILIADDHKMIRDGLRLLLEQSDDIEVIGEAGNGYEVLEIVKDTDELDIIILDINMPGKDGIEVTREIKHIYPEIKILIVSMFSKQEFIKNLMEAGIDGYILKNSGKTILLEAVHTLSNNDPYYAGEVTKVIAQSYQKSKIFDSPMDFVLTNREKEVISLISNGYTTSEMAKKLYISTHTVSTHRKNILGKLNVKNTAGITKYALQTGIVKWFDI